MHTPDPADLERVFGRPVPSYDIEPIDPHLRIHSVTGGVYRITADGDSAVVKIVRHGGDEDTTGGLWVSGADPAHRNYWKREWLAFDSGVLSALPGRLRAPHTLLTSTVGDEWWIWMEDARGRTGSAMTLDDYRRAAHDLGTTQGAFASGAAKLPDHDWLSRRWLRGWVEACEPLAAALAPDGAVRDDRLAALRPLRDRVLALWARREELLAIVEAAPQTLVHCDFWPTNLYAGDDGTTVAIDWSQIGIGAVAQDLDQITLDTVWMQVRPDESIELLEEVIVPAYVDGLRESGFTATDVDVHRWYAAAAGAHYPWMAGMQVIRAPQLDFIDGLEKRFNRSFADVVTDRARVIERAVELGEWALGSTT